MAGVAKRQLPVRRQDRVEEGDEARLDRAVQERGVHVRQRVCRPGGRDRLGGQVPLQQRAKQRRRGTLSRHVSEGEAEPSVGQVDILEEIAADRPAGHHLGRRIEEVANPAAGGEQGLLDLRCGRHLLLQPGLLDGVAVELGVVDGDRRFCRQRLERRPCLAGHQRALLAAVEIQHTDTLVFRRALGRFHVPHEPERHTQHVADSESHRAHVLVGKVAIEQVRLDPGLSGPEHLLRDLPTGLEPAPGQCLPVPGPPELELQRLVLAGQHHEAALGAADGDRRIHHQRQDIVQHLPGAQRPEPFEQHRHLVHLADRGLAPRSFGRRVAQTEHQFGAAAASKLDLVAIGELVLGDLLAVDEGAIPRPGIAQLISPVHRRDLGMIARHLAARQMQVAADPPADDERILGDVHGPRTELVVDFETWLGHEPVIRISREG